MKFTLKVLHSNKVQAACIGLDRDPKFVTVDDMRKVVEVEAYLEKLFGFRFHIDTIGDE